MHAINHTAVVGAALAAFVASFAWYLLFGKALARVSPAFARQKRAAWKYWVVGGQNLVVAYVLAMVLPPNANAGTSAATGALIWFGFSAIQWVGAMLWEDTRFAMAAIHAGDWLVKIVLIATILGFFR